MSLKSLYARYTSTLNSGRDLAPLALRLVLAYGFCEPAWNKLQDVHGIADWFQSMGLPAPYLQAWLATLVESLGVILLTLGLGTRIISIPLMLTMLVAIKKVHWENGFSAGNNGFEIPFYYLVMLFCLLMLGSGRYSLDHLISRKRAGSLA